MEAPPLSPFPHIKQQPGSPRRISQQHSIYVSPHKNGSGPTPRSALLYKFNGSPSKVRCRNFTPKQLHTCVKNSVSLWCNGMGSILEVLVHRIDPQPSTVG